MLTFSDRSDPFSAGAVLPDEGMTAPTATQQETVAGLVSELARAFKASAMYPADHPARNRFIDRLVADLDACLEDAGGIEIVISAGKLKYRGEEVETRDQSSSVLARECFQRQINTLRFLKGMTREDYDALFDLLAVDPGELRAKGGAVDFVRARGSGALQVEEVDYDGILQHREVASDAEDSLYTPEILSPVAPPDAAEEQTVLTPTVFDAEQSQEISQDVWLEGKLQELDAAADLAAYKGILRDIFTSLKATGTMGLSQYSVMVVRHLGRHLSGRFPDDRRRVALAAVRELSSPEVLEVVAGHVAVKDQQEREAVQAVLDTIPDIAIPALLGRLAEEDKASGRKALIVSLSRYGDRIRPHLERWLRDERWYVVRNALGLLSQVGTRGDSAAVVTYLDHPNPKVKLEALRFLSRHPVALPDDKIDTLLNDPDAEVVLRTINAIGILQGPRGVEKLLAYARKPLVGQGDVARREAAIRGLGRVGGRQSVVAIRSLIARKAVVDQVGFDRIQSVGVEALEEIGGGAAAEALRQAERYLKGDARRAAEDILRRWGG